MTNVDTASDTWLDVEKWAKREITRLREMNDNDLDTAETSSVRGEIKALKKVLALADKPAQTLQVASTGCID